MYFTPERGREEREEGRSEGGVRVGEKGLAG
jgi:hypothetical protein